MEALTCKKCNRLQLLLKALSSEVILSGVISPAKFCGKRCFAASKQLPYAIHVLLKTDRV